jgi:hypothetical protein
MMLLPLLIMVVMKLLEDKLVLVVSLNLRASIILILLMFMLKVPLMVLLLILLVLPVLSYQVNSQLAWKIVIHAMLKIFVTLVLLDSMYLLRVTNVLLI